MLSEKVSKALKKRMHAMREKMACGKCGCRIPVYPGRYPTICPDCGESLGGKDKDKNLNELTPWQQFTQFNALSEEEEKVPGTHDTRKEAKDQLAAVYM